MTARLLVEVGLGWVSRSPGEAVMRLEVRLPRVKPGEMSEPELRPCAKCGGRLFRPHQRVATPVRDTVYHRVTAPR